MAHEVIHDYYLNGAVVYIDDTIIYGRNEETFLTMLDQILSKLVEFNFRLKLSKHYFGMDHIEFLGHVFIEKAIQLSDERGQGVKQIPEPTSLKAVKNFVGMVNCFRNSINGLLGHLIPLTMLTKRRYSLEELYLQNVPKFRSKESKIFLYKGRN